MVMHVLIDKKIQSLTDEVMNFHIKKPEEVRMSALLGKGGDGLQKILRKSFYHEFL